METLIEIVMTQNKMSETDASALILIAKKRLGRGDPFEDINSSMLNNLNPIFERDIIQFEPEAKYNINVKIPKKCTKSKNTVGNEETVINGFKLSDDQAGALKKMLNMAPGDRIFLTGKAGSGKSTLTECFCSKAKGKVVRLASTGIAAQNINGRTMHAFMSWYGPVRKGNPFKLAQRLGLVTYIVVDEISMVGMVTFEDFMNQIEAVKKNIKIIFVGDFAQLRPVPEEECPDNARSCSHSEYWQDVEEVTLTTIHRQSDPEYIQALNAVREGEWQDEAYAKLYYERLVPAIPDDCAFITPTKKIAADRNRDRLEMLGETIYENEAVIHTGDWPKNESSVRIPRIVKYAEGCRVLMLNNDKDKRWVNGSMGTVVQIHSKGDFRYVTIKLDTGYDVDVFPTLFEIVNGDGIIKFSFTQFPFQLGYAMTIHKSQGLTLDKVAVDMASRHFAAGMTYVALSRCRSREGLYLINNTLGVIE